MLKGGKIDKKHYIWRRMNDSQRSRITMAHNMLKLYGEKWLQHYSSVIDLIMAENENWYHDMEFETNLTDERIPLSLEPEDFDDLIELALATKDREWFEELVIRKKFIKLKHEQA